MSLADFVIDGFGGYEKAKAVLDNPNAHILHNVEGLKQRLLEYRRQHNIFEIGDLVAYRTLPYERLFSVRYVGGDEIVIYELWDEMGAKTFTEMHPYLDIRHATDAEIKAGKRLGVDSE